MSSSSLSIASGHLYTLYLFIASDLKTIVGPSTCFGLSNSIAGQPLIENPPLNRSGVLFRLPIVAVSVTVSLLPVVISNQTRPDSVLEDRINKPWRALPSGRVHPAAAKRLMHLANVISLLFNFWYGNEVLWLITILGDWLYNDKGAANKNYWARNATNAAAFFIYGLEATKVAVSPSRLNFAVYGWLALLALVTASTVQTQDLPDREGDKARGRHTMPLVLGELKTRWAVAVPAVLWSIILPLVWRSALFGYLVTLPFGLILASRVLLLRTLEADEWTWRCWNLWMVSLYSLPLASRIRLR
ncbi:MAG: hypothetical protein Q9203_006844 [Teloschistes exilis]